MVGGIFSVPPTTTGSGHPTTPPAVGSDVLTTAPHTDGTPDDTAATAAAVDAGLEPQESLPASSSRSLASRPVPWLLLAGLVALLAPLRGGLGPVRDINDLYWHLIYGQELLSGTPIVDAGRGWSFAPVADTWISTQWLAELLFGRLEQLGGVQAMLVYRAVAELATIALLAAVTLVRRPVRAGVWMFTLGAVAVSFTVEERSQQVTFLLAPLVGWWAQRLWREGRLPQWWIVLPLIVVWSNMHGGWVILPVTLGLAALARLVDHGRRDRSGSLGLLIAAASALASCVSPSGIDNLLALVRFSASTTLIIEWQPVVPWSPAAAPLVLLVVTIVIAWARGVVRPSRGEMLLVLALALFGLVAWRDITPAVLLLCPIVTGTVARAMGESDPTVEPGQRPPLARTALVLGVVGAVIALTLSVRQAPVTDPSVPTHLIDRIATTTTPQRVLDTWNISGPILWFGGRPPKVTVVVDGRADRYGASFITRYDDTLAARPGWQQQVDQLSPTAALLRTDEALAGALVAERGWVQVSVEGDYVLLHAPDAPGWPQA